MEVDYDPSVLHLEGFDWDPGFGDDPLLRCRPDGPLAGARGCEATPGFLSLGEIGGLPSGRVGALRFVAVAPGRSDVVLAPVSPFSDLVGNEVPVELGAGEVIVVPEPAVGSALVMGALALAGLGRRSIARRTP